MSRPRARSRRRLCDLSARDWLYLAIAAGELARARIVFAVRPAGATVAHLQAGGARASNERAVDLARLSWAIGAVGARAPWRADCLVQAMAAAHWLGRHGVRWAFYLGVAPAEGTIAAHAWLRVGDTMVTGGDGAAFTQLVAPGRRAR